MLKGSKNNGKMEYKRTCDLLLNFSPAPRAAAYDERTKLLVCVQRGKVLKIRSDVSEALRSFVKNIKCVDLYIKKIK